MHSLFDQSSSQAPTDLKPPQRDPTQAPLLWKGWSHQHPEFKRTDEVRISYEGKILIVGGYLMPDEDQKALNLILVDPKTQEFQVIPSTGDAESCCEGAQSACYWKDSKIVVFGGLDYAGNICISTVAVITLKDLDSQNASAHWEEMQTPTKLSRHHHSAHIYQDKMYVFGGVGPDHEFKHEVWCLDLGIRMFLENPLTRFKVAWTWVQCDAPIYASIDKWGQKSKIFHENKAYVLLKGTFLQQETVLFEFNFDTLASREFTIPASLPKFDPKRIFDPWPEVINGKIYFHKDFDNEEKDDPTRRLIWAYDLDSESWSEIETESPPEGKKFGSRICCGHHLIFQAYWVDNDDDDDGVFGQFWSIELNPPRTTKTSSTSATVNKVQKTMKEFFLEALYSDVSFEVESQIIPAHKWLLIQKSKFFSDLFTSEMLPSKITINNLKAPTFRALLEYLYSDHTEIDDTIALELLQQAEKYSIPVELKTACEKHATQNIGPENYVAFGKLAESIGATFLRDAVVAFIAKNMKKIKPRKDFNQISNSLLRDSIVKFIVK